MSEASRMRYVIINLLLAVPVLSAEELPVGTGYTDFFGYEDCVFLENASTRVVLCHQAGGRVLEYSLNGVNAIYLNPDAKGSKPGDTRVDMTGGRFDIGPELVVPKRKTLWAGEWTARITGPRTAELLSQYDDSTGVQLRRTFSLDETTSKLSVTQTIHNQSESSREYCHWSRTFAQGQGIVVIPLTEPSRMPKKYVMYESGGLINARPDDPKIVERDSHLIITGPPARPKLGMDSAAGWFTYLMPNNLMFTKQFAVDRSRVYNELAGLTISIWYPDGPMTELEPIGPREILEPDDAASFTETWYLSDHSFPSDQQVDVRAINAKATAQMRGGR